MTLAPRFLAPLVVAGAAALATGEAAAQPHETAILQALDKVTARVSTIEAPVGQAIRFGTLEVIVRHCDKRPPEETPESSAFLDIWEVRPGEAAVSLFRGWMFASSPALSALEHPVYDIWVLECGGKPLSGDAPVPQPGGAAPKLPDLQQLFKNKNN
jgi:hypothetical protein